MTYVETAFTETARRLLAEKRDDFIVELFDSLRQEIAELVDDARLTALLEASVTENIVAAVNFLEAGTSIRHLTAPTAALVQARTLAQRDVPLSALFRAYRMGHAMFVRMGIDLIADTEPTHHIELTQQLIGRTAEYIDKVCEQVGRAYEAERDQWLGDRGGIRQQWVADVLSGRPLDLGEAEASLGYRFAATHVGVHLWTDSEMAGVDARAIFEEARRLLIGVLSPVGPPLLVPRDEREMHAWFPVRGGYSVPVDDVAAAIKKAREVKVHLAIGRAEAGVDGFRRTINQANRVKDIMMVSTNKLPTSVAYDELGPAALMASDMDALRRFVTRTLGNLAKDGEREETLRETLRSFLGHNRSYAATASAMILHRNSVQYRVQRALELCASDLNEADVALDLHVALNAAHWLGQAVLERN
ncbi:MAG: PucR family transcriptional regulator [Aeromicrobium sp.]